MYDEHAHNPIFGFERQAHVRCDAGFHQVGIVITLRVDLVTDNWFPAADNLVGGAIGTCALVQRRDTLQDAVGLLYTGDQFSTVLYQVTLENAPTLASTFLSKRPRNKTLAQFVAGWAKLDGPAAIAYAKGPARGVYDHGADGRLTFVTAAVKSWAGSDPEACLDYWKQNIPIGRVIEPEEIGELAAFLLSSRSTSITGANMFADGGMTSQLVSREPFTSKPIDGR